ncbi:4'-phosphopantetheinyl transferase [Flavobacterium circumlabens]|uniref:4'-phosphopantetheinyl transferase n=1 Tax=Flavobacterium circumlabens TaxID=2133765 RepID=A0A4Y7UDS1_9FLAO|nr:4'-phosphopantetheinyl transferase superfamily protein [Flavobacterium circumlabens]TCN57658.1 4'-phosphopantetheinyl transferase superfamily protein [Flavobacterium circumlabens]TEB43962.1 4'-phosphopantetheinyl transferase [Flavobacterium circumlabens]
MNKGKIELRRNGKNFEAGYCFIKGELNSLLKYHDLLSNSEQSYYDELKFERRKASYLLGRITAKNAVCELSQADIKSVSIEFGIFHFPVVKKHPAQNIQVSISHCGDIGIALAFPEEHPMGIDIEKISFDKVSTMKTTMSLNEIELIDLHPDLTLATGCTIIWTAKESLAKIFRTGLTIDFKVLEIDSIEKIKSCYVSHFRNVSQYKAISFHLNEYICSLVIPKKTTIDLDFFLKIFTNNFYDQNQNF